MPACRFRNINKQGAYLLWRIDEPEEVLKGMSTPTVLAQPAYKKITHPGKRREWLAARLALKTLLARLGPECIELQKDTWGKPYLPKSHWQISLAHCTAFALVAVNQQDPVGVDIQLPCETLQRVKAKFLNEEEIKDSSNDLEKLCIYWCAKEAIYKAYGGKHLSLKKNISIRPFITNTSGTVWGTVGTKLFVVRYDFYASHVLTWSKVV